MTESSTRDEVQPNRKRARRYRVDGAYTCIDIRLHSAFQLFDGRDPAPFRERDLDEDAVEYLSAAAEEISAGAAIKVVFWIGSRPPRPGAEAAAEPSAAEIVEAVHAHFEHERDEVDRRLRHQRRFAKLSLLVGLSVLVVFLALAQFTSRLPQGAVREILREGLVITGWVAMWRPLEVLLYDWWPLDQRRKTLSRVIEASIEVRAASDAP